MMNGSNGGYIPHSHHSDNAINHHQQAIDQNYVQRQRRQHDNNSGANRQGVAGIGNPLPFDKDDQSLRLLQQLAAEQSQLLERFQVANHPSTAPSAVVARPTEQFLTIALNGKNLHSSHFLFMI